MRSVVHSKHPKVGFLRSAAGGFPLFEGHGPFGKVKRSNDGDFVSEFVRPVITIPGAFLTIGRESVSDDFMRYAAVDNESDGEGIVFEDCLVSVANNASDELFRALRGDFVFAFVAHPPAEFNVPQNCFPVERGEDFKRWGNYLTRRRR